MMNRQTETEYFSGQGDVFVAPIVDGVRGALRWLGNVPSLEISTDVSKLEHKESHTGFRLTDKTLIQETKVGFKATIEEFSEENIQLAFRGDVVEVQAGQVTNEQSPNDLSKGGFWVLANTKVSNVTITDSTASTPKTLEEGKDYTVNSDFGRIQLVGDISKLKLPLVVAYKYEARKTIQLMGKQADSYYVRFDGLNTAQGNKPVLVEMYSVDIDPAKTLSFISDEINSFDLEGNVLSSNQGTIGITKL